MAAQQVVFYAGVAAFVVSAVLAMWAVYTFFALDIRGVTKDLASRQRVAREPSTGGVRRRVAPRAVARSSTDSDLSTLAARTPRRGVGDGPIMADNRDAVPTSVASVTGPSAFRVSRKIVHIHPDKVISAD